MRIPLPGLETLTHLATGALAGLRDQVSGKHAQERSLVILLSVLLSLES